MRIDSVQVGVPKTYPSGGKGGGPWSSAIAKETVEGRIWAGVGGLSGDRVANQRIHGGPHRAVLMYAAEHYPRWRAEWGRKDVLPGAFGENLTVSGFPLGEATVCLGDVFTAGQVLMEVSSPRLPCATLARRHGRPHLVREVLATHRHGWYTRILREGWLEAGMSLLLTDRPFPQWTLVRTTDVYVAKAWTEEAHLLSECPALNPEWREELRSRGAT